MKINFEYIDTQDALKQASKQWQVDEIGIDLECENNLHHYGSYISLIQISTPKKHFIVDVLTLKDIEPVLDMLKDSSIEKIFHDVGFDLRILQHQFRVRVKNVFDTFVAAQLLGKKEVGLGSLLKEYFGIEKKSKFQMADWTKRPLKQEMLAYAIKDTLYLIRLRDKLVEELHEKNRLSWAKEEFLSIENKELTYKEGNFWDFRGVKKLTDKQRGILKRFFDLRKNIAKTINRPVHYVINTKKLIDLVKDPPETVNAWGRIRGVHPIVRKKAKEFFEAVEQGKKEEIKLPIKERKWYTTKQRQNAERLGELRDIIAQELKIERHLIFNKEQMQEVVLRGSMNSLHKWQRELINKYGLRLA